MTSFALQSGALILAMSKSSLVHTSRVVSS